jgi:hypothetical protein
MPIDHLQMVETINDARREHQRGVCAGGAGDLFPLLNMEEKIGLVRLIPYALSSITAAGFE